jgi:hypothetical protein
MPTGIAAFFPFVVRLVAILQEIIKQLCQPGDGILFSLLHANTTLMSDNKKQTDQPESKQAVSNQNYELYYLEEKLGVTRAEVMEAIKVVGNDRHKVEGYLRINKK